jgi:Ca2+-binding RTX toxin-like protein
MDNVLAGNSAANVLTGGAGHDTYVIGIGDTVVEQANEGIDTVQTDQNYVLDANLENLTLTGRSNLNGTGNALDNRLVGNDGNNLLDGGLGEDQLLGGKGNDIYMLRAGDTVVEQADEGEQKIDWCFALFVCSVMMFIMFCTACLVTMFCLAGTGKTTILSGPATRWLSRPTKASTQSRPIRPIHSGRTSKISH